MEGGVRPCNYVPEMIKWNREGKFPIEKLIKYFPAEEYEKAIEEMETGETVKPVLLWS
jgi:Zn-dependent alcohol dehydrogenase